MLSHAKPLVVEISATGSYRVAADPFDDDDAIVIEALSTGCRRRVDIYQVNPAHASTVMTALVRRVAVYSMHAV